MTKLIQSWISSQAKIRPQSVAIVIDNNTMTYATLDTLSTQIARTLIASGCRRGDRVCLLMPKTLMAIAGIVGIYKADCVYVPLDPSNPQARLAKIFLSSDSHCLLASVSTAMEVEKLLTDENVRKSTVVGWMDTRFSSAKNIPGEFSLVDILASSSQPLDYQNSSSDPAHILFTSGSTGTPKGVVITHANVIAFIEWATEYFKMDATDRISGQVPLCFDLSIFDIFGSLSVGAELHLTPPAISLLPHKLAKWIRDSRLTQWFSAPSLLNYMAKYDAVKYEDFPHLKRIIWCGEVFPVPSLIYWMRQLPGKQFTNLYGPTETTIASSYYTLAECPSDDKQAIPVGTACPGEELLILDQELNKVSAGETGDLYIRGHGLSPGYWRDPVKTHEVFIKDPFSSNPSDRIYKTGDLARLGNDGLVYFKGRADTQIKSRGYRIELGEIESAFNTISDLQECAVVAVETDDFEGVSVCCAYVPFKDHDITSAQIREQLSRLIPSYMLPSQWMPLKSLPKNVNGKIDRNQIKDGFSKRLTETMPGKHSKVVAM